LQCSCSAQQLDGTVNDRQSIAPKIECLVKELKAVGLSLADWRIKQIDFSDLEVGFERAYKRGQKAMKKVLNSSSMTNCHNWRKRVKDYWYHCNLLCLNSGELAEEPFSEIKKLEQLLGDNHDLDMLKITLNLGAKQLNKQACQSNYQSKMQDIPQNIEQCILNQQNSLKNQAIAIGLNIYKSGYSPHLSMLEKIKLNWQ